MRTTAVMSCLVLGACEAESPPTAPNATFEILPPDTQIGGLTLDEAGAEWWRWVLETPVSTSPQLDQTGAFCSENQTGADPFFLAGAFGETLTRTCTVRHDGVFLLAITAGYMDNCGVPPEAEVPEEDWPAVLAGVLSPVEASLEIDGVTIGASLDDFSEYKTAPTPFTYESPADDSLPAYLGYPFTGACDSLAQGYFVPLTLDAGEHVVRVYVLGNASVKDVTHNLTVEPD